jgi:hypothetical protein
MSSRPAGLRLVAAAGLALVVTAALYAVWPHTPSWTLSTAIVLALE